MKFNQNPNLRVEDFQSEQSWIGRLFVQINPLIQAISQIFNNNIDFENNIPSVFKEYEISSFQEFSFLWPHSAYTPNDVRVLKAIKGAQNEATILLLAWSFDQTARTVTISRIVEVLDDSVAELSGRYKFSIRATV